MSIYWWKAVASCLKTNSRNVLQPQVVLNLFLIFHQISGSCSGKIVLIKNRAHMQSKNKQSVPEPLVSL